MTKASGMRGLWASSLVLGAISLGLPELPAQQADVSIDEPVESSVVKRYRNVVPPAADLLRLPGYSAEPTAIDAAFQRVAKDYRVELYPRALRGPRGTFLAKSGNSLDRALLLYSLIAGNPGNHIGSARIVYSKLTTEEGAKVYALCEHGLAARLAARRTSFQALENGAGAGGEHGAALQKARRIRTGILSRLEDLARQDIALVEPHTADFAAKTAANLKAQQEQARGYAQDHYWLQVQVQGRPEPLDLDPTYPGLSPGQRVKAPSSTYPVSSLPDELLTPITFTVVANWQEGTKHINRTVLRLQTDAASAAAYPIFLIHPEQGDPFRAGIAAPVRATAAAFDGAASALGGLFGGPKPSAPPARYAGTTHKPVFYAGPQQFEGAYLERPAPGSGSDPELVSEMLSIDIQTPVTAKITRFIFDRAGGAQRATPGKWQLKPMEMAQDEAPMPLQPIRSFLVTTGDLDEAAALETASGIREEFLKNLFASHYQFELWRQLVPAVFRNGELSGYTASPQISSMTMGPLVGRVPGEGAAYAATSFTFDLLRNGQTSLSSGDLRARGAQDYLLEQLFLEHLLYEDPAQAPPLFTAHNTLARAAGTGGRLVWAAVPGDLPAALSPDVRAHLAARLATEYVLIPADPVRYSSKSRRAWLLVNRATYQVRDETEAGFGAQAAVEWEEGEAEAVARAKEICQFQQCLDFATKSAKVLNLIWGTRIELLFDVADAYAKGKACLSVVVKVTAKKEWLGDKGFQDKKKALDGAAKKGLVTPSKEEYERLRKLPPGGHTTPAGTNKDWDHNVELACGGTNKGSNVNPLDSSINRSMGATLGKVCGALCEGTKIENIIWEFVYLMPGDTGVLADAGYSPMPRATMWR